MSDDDEVIRGRTRAERDFVDTSWRITVLERAVTELMAIISLQNELLPRRFKAEIDDMVGFLDRTENTSPDPARQMLWKEERELILDLAQSLLPAQYREDLPPMP